MNAVPTREREEVHRLVELVPDQDLPTVRRMLAGLARDVDPVSWALEHAPADDEPVTQEDIEAEAEASEDIAAGRVYPHDEAKRLIMAD